MCLKSHRCLNILGSMSTGQTEHDGTLFTPAFSFSSDHGKVVNVSEVKRQRKKKVEVAGDGKKKKEKEKSEEKKKTTHDFFRDLIPITQHFSFWNFFLFAHLFILSSFSFLLESKRVCLQGFHRSKSKKDILRLRSPCPRPTSTRGPKDSARSLDLLLCGSLHVAKGRRLNSLSCSLSLFVQGS